MNKQYLYRLNSFILLICTGIVVWSAPKKEMGKWISMKILPPP